MGNQTVFCSFFLRHTGVNERAENHIAAGAGDTAEVGEAWEKKSFSLCYGSIKNHSLSHEARYFE